MSDKFPGKDFLKHKIVPAVIAGSAFLSARGSVQQSSESLRSTLSEKPSAIEMVPEVVKTDKIGNLSINYNSDGLPVSYEFEGSFHHFSDQEILLMKLRVQNAKLTGDPEFLTRIDGDYILPNTPTLQASPDRPYVDKLPDDVMSDEELKQNGVIEVIQGESVKVRIRRKAFESEGILYDLAKSQLTDNPIKLKIVLVDGPYVSGVYMSDPKYKSLPFLPGYLNQDVEDFRQQKINEVGKEVDDALSHLQDAIKSKDELQIEGQTAITIAIQSNLLDYKYARQDELTEMMISETTNAVGQFYENTGTDDNGNQIATVFIAVGNSLLRREHIQIFADRKGKIILHATLGIDTQSVIHDPNEAMGFPRPDDFYRDPNANEKDDTYPYGGPSYQLGFILTHELKHLDRIILGPNEYGNIRDDNEYNTDMSAMAQIDEEYQKWITDGQNDYPFVFQQGSAYQVTEFEKPKDGENQEV
jgi:hypothetical protein